MCSIISNPDLFQKAPKPVYFKTHIRPSIHLADPIDETFGPTALGLANNLRLTKFRKN